MSAGDVEALAEVIWAASRADENTGDWLRDRADRIGGGDRG